MRVSALFGETLKELPSGVEVESHKLMIKAGFIRQVSSGIFAYMHLAQRAMQKIEQILREEIDYIGGQEINMPVVHPAEIWKKTGRWQAVDETMVRFNDRAGRDMLLGMTHEEIVGFLTASEITSYRQLPCLIYQIQTKFRDEPRARGGLIRVREFVMKDSYSLDATEEGLDRQYQKHYDAYFKIFKRAGLPVISVKSDTGMMGGNVAHEYMYITDIGEDKLLLCTQCDYRANQEVAIAEKDSPDYGNQKELNEVHTPNAKTIEDVASYLSVAKSQTAKAVFFKGYFQGADEFKLIFVVIRGDLEVNETKLRNLIKAKTLIPAERNDIQKCGAEPGFASPIGINREGVIIVADESVVKTSNLVAGANKVDYHTLNVNYERDFIADFVGEIALVEEGDLCLHCGKVLKQRRAVEVGNIFKLGTKYSEGLCAYFDDENGNKKPVVMGSYGIGVGRLLACIAEEYHDDKGIIWPVSVAPYQVYMVSIGDENMIKIADEVYQNLKKEGVEVLYDDRNERPGVKFNDADLRGMPVRVTVSKKSLEKGGAEVKLRQEKEYEIVPLDTLAKVINNKILTLRDEILKNDHTLWH